MPPAVRARQGRSGARRQVDPQGLRAREVVAPCRTCIRIRPPGSHVRAVVQRVAEASVTVEGEEIAAIGPGLLVLLCAMKGDAPDAPARMAAKVARLRVFRDEAGRMNRSLLDTGGAALVVSQFTLAAETRGNRPGFTAAAPPEEGEAAVEATVAALRAMGIGTQTGRFGADMAVRLTNDGPVTIPLDL